MIKKMSLAMFLVLILLFSIGSIQASDDNGTMSDSSDDVALPIESNLQIDEINQTFDDNASFEENTKNQTGFASPTASVYYGGNYRATLKDLNANSAIANKSVGLSINNVYYSAVTNSKGVFSIKLKLTPGEYTAVSYFAGDEDYNASNITCQVTILPSVVADNVTKYYKGSKTYQATYFNGNGNALKNRKVTITVNGIKYTQKTDSNGSASFPIDFKPGTYKVTTTNPSTGYELTTTFKILSTITASNLKKVRGDDNKFTAKFLKSNGKALAKKKVKVKIDGKIHNYRTNSKGELKLAFNNLKKGTYKVVCYNVDGLSKSRTVEIYSIASTKLTTSSYTFLPGDAKAINIKFTTALDDGSKAGKVIKIYINGMCYAQQTDANGEINFNLPSLGAGLYTLECVYDGNNFFKYSHVSRFITILDTSNTNFRVESGTSFGNFAGTPFSVSLKAGNVPLIRKAVSFSVNGETYSGVTDDYGIASMPVYLDIGNYTITYKSFADAKVKGTSGSCNITVFERINTNVSCSFKASYKDISQTFKAYLKDSNGTPMAYEPVELVLGWYTYEETTDENGYVVFKTSVAGGKYDFSVVFRGNNDYNSSSISGSTTVTYSKYANGINEKNAVGSSDYLKETRNCQVSNAQIKSLVNSLTKGLTSNLDKAKVLFNYVRDNIGYSYYYDTHKGAAGTLASKSGNCVDQAHLLIAMYRAAGLMARYVHGYCKFYDDGQYCGHVWTQVLIDGSWICGDPIDYCNELGRIDNWNTKNHKIWNKYVTLPF